MSEEDLFYKDVECRMEELKQKPIKKEKETRGEKISKTFSLLLGLMILIGLLFTLLGILR
ncbi:TPA: accessory secretory system protein Asp4 [Streptococcus pneumoniae]|nr:accessory secretory system protein Asp4 [Streptococcus pneumoniae]